MYRVIYISSATFDLNSSELEIMLHKFRENNQKKGITGLLLYVEGDFIQVLEGVKEQVVQLFTSIKKDPRNRSVITLFEGAIKQNQFPDWRMGFCKTTYSELGELIDEKEFSKEAFVNYEDHMAMILINSFVKNHRTKVVIH
jgi:uncharacterized protein YbgA (DUF1722 family)